MTEEQIAIAFRLISARNDLKITLDELNKKQKQQVYIGMKYSSLYALPGFCTSDLIPLVQEKLDNAEVTLRTLGITTS